jgi:hypothetical protein
MRYLFLTALVISACSTQPSVTPQTRAERAVTEFLKKQLNDPSSYQSIEFGKLDSIKVDTAEIHRLRVIEMEEKDGLLATIDMRPFYDSFAKATSDSMHQLGYWQIEHSYRAKNGFGALMRTTDIFYLDTNFKVTRAKDQETQ